MGDIVAIGQAETGTHDGASAGSRVRPYEPSVLDRLILRIDRLPGHGWWVYPLAIIAFLAWIHLWLWFRGFRPLGTFEPASLGFVFYGPFGVAAIHYLNRAGNHAMAAFRPALRLSDEEIEVRRYELVTFPAGGWLWVFLAVGVVLGVGVVATQQAAAVGMFGPTLADWLIVAAPVAVAGYSGFAAVTFHTLRQLRCVARLHREAHIDLFDVGPLYAFSGLTMRTGLVWITVGYYSLTVSAAFVSGNAIALPVTLGNFVFATACFVVPLYGLHGRLVDVKAGLLREASRRVEAVTTQLYARVDGEQLAGIKEVTDALGGVVAARDQVLKLPTWPWPPRALGQFATALVLPVVVYVVSRLVGQQLGT